MMTLKLRIIIMLVLLVGLITIVNLIRKRSLELKYALTWIILDVGLFVVVLVPGLIDKIAAFCGIYNPMNMVFFLGFLFSVIVIFGLTMSLSRNSDRVRKIAQKTALNEYRIKRLEENNKKDR